MQRSALLITLKNEILRCDVSLLFKQIVDSAITSHQSNGNSLGRLQLLIYFRPINVDGKFNATSIVIWISFLGVVIVSGISRRRHSKFIHFIWIKFIRTRNNCGQVVIRGDYLVPITVIIKTKLLNSLSVLKSVNANFACIKPEPEPLCAIISIDWLSQEADCKTKKSIKKVCLFLSSFFQFLLDHVLIIPPFK